MASDPDPSSSTASKSCCCKFTMATMGLILTFLTLLSSAVLIFLGVSVSDCDLACDGDTDGAELLNEGVYECDGAVPEVAYACTSGDSLVYYVQQAQTWEKISSKTKMCSMHESGVVGQAGLGTLVLFPWPRLGHMHVSCRIGHVSCRTDVHRANAVGTRWRQVIVGEHLADPGQRSRACYQRKRRRQSSLSMCLYACVA